MAYPIWQATITDDNGNVLPGVEITVVNEETGLNATLYSTRNGTSKSNPFFATVDGFAQFYSEPGLYRITATDGGTGTTQTFRYVRLVEVATPAEAIAGTAGVLPDAAGVKAHVDNSIAAVTSTLGTASTKDVGTAAGNVLPAGASRLGQNPNSQPLFNLNTDGMQQGLGLYYLSANVGAIGSAFMGSSPAFVGTEYNFTTKKSYVFFGNNGFASGSRLVERYEIRTTGNTTVDPNGFIKAASPIVSLYKDRAESNGSAELEEMQFERIATGHYRLTGVPELSRDGWYIETPKDRNGNVYFTLDYEESPGVLDIYTYTPDYSTGRAENGAPVDIIDGRFVSLRFAESPETTPSEEE